MITHSCGFVWNRPLKGPSFYDEQFIDYWLLSDFMVRSKNILKPSITGTGRNYNGYKKIQPKKIKTLPQTLVRD